MGSPRNRLFIRTLQIKDDRLVGLYQISMHSLVAVYYVYMINVKFDILKQVCRNVLLDVIYVRSKEAA
jgi:hypothetical protein